MYKNNEGKTLQNSVRWLHALGAESLTGLLSMNDGLKTRKRTEEGWWFPSPHRRIFKPVMNYEGGEKDPDGEWENQRDFKRVSISGVPNMVPMDAMAPTDAFSGTCQVFLERAQPAGGVVQKGFWLAIRDLIGCAPFKKKFLWQQLAATTAQWSSLFNWR